MRGRVLRIFGLACLIGSLAWWLYVALGALRLRGVDARILLDEGLPCLAYTSHACREVYSAVGKAGGIPFSPLLTWIGIVAYLLGHAPQPPKKTRKGDAPAGEKPEGENPGAPRKRRRPAEDGPAASPAGGAKAPWEMAAEG